MNTKTGAAHVAAFGFIGRRNRSVEPGGYLVQQCGTFGAECGFKVQNDVPNWGDNGANRTTGATNRAHFDFWPCEKSKNETE